MKEMFQPNNGADCLEHGKYEVISQRTLTLYLNPSDVTCRPEENVAAQKLFDRTHQQWYACSLHHEKHGSSGTGTYPFPSIPIPSTHPPLIKNINDNNKYTKHRDLIHSNNKFKRKNK